ncbi:hypothetical protein DY000_02017027 [Brassica cretica]|uniref:RNase H type-1 domain-containing protein n=1 Tax=Brassica cretica TaxID=69181 RepID=A0ABQ7CT72_BRACR|nr:hypothetical protein DY000_02017027 [Brassica cretica]
MFSSPAKKHKRNSAVEESSRMVFPWVLWHLWKARNGLAFENRVEDPLSIARRAFEEASSWIDAHKLGSSWIGPNTLSEAAWILRDENNKTLLRSHRSYSYSPSKTESDLWSMLWAVESMYSLHKTNVIFEASSEEVRKVLTNPSLFPHFSRNIHAIQSYLSEIEIWRLDHCLPERNEAQDK